MTTEEALALFARLVRDVVPDVDLADVDPTAPIQDELELDSMDFLHLVIAVHDATGIEIPERDYPRLATVGGFVAYVAEGAR